MSTSVPESGPSGRLAPLVAAFRPRTWRHLLYALVAPGPLLLIALPYVMRPAQADGRQWLGVPLLLTVLGVVAVIGPVVERSRSRLLLGEEIGQRPRGVGRLGRGLLFLIVNLLLGTVAFGLVVGWVIVSARNLTYPIWGWAPYPDPAWGGPSPAGAVALHFAAGVVAFLFGPWAVITMTNRQVRVARHLIGA